MKDNHVQDQLSAYLDQALSPNEKKRVEAHLTSCSDCEKIFLELKSVVSWMKAVPQPSPRVGLETRLAARLQDKKSHRWSWMGGLATAMVALIALVIVREKDLQHLEPSVPQEISVLSELVDKLEQTSTVGREKAKALKPALSPSSVRLLDNEKQGQAVGFLAEKKSEEARPVVNEGLLKSDARELRRVGASLTRRDEKEAVPPSEISGPLSAITKPEQRVIRSKKDWEALLNRMGQPDLSVMFSDVDFSKQMIAAVFMGQQSRLGAMVRIVGEEEIEKPQGRTLVIKVEQTFSPAGLSSAAAQPQPFTLKVLPLFIGPVQFQDVN